MELIIPVIEENSSDLFCFYNSAHQWESSPWALTAQMAAGLYLSSGECAVWCSTLAVPQSSCARALGGAVTGGRSSAWVSPGNHSTALADGYRAGLRLLGLPSNALGSPVQCWVLHRPRGARCSGGWWWWCILPPQAALWPEVTLCSSYWCIKKPLLKFRFINDVVRRRNVMEFRILQIS